MKQLLETSPLILMEAAIVERLRRSGEVRLHETLVNAPLIYDKTAGDAMGTLYQGYMEMARDARLAILVCTPTWRANRARVHASAVPNTLNTDAARYLTTLRDEGAYGEGAVLIGGMIGCKNDCYRPDEGLSVSEAQHFHAWQVEQLAEGGVDFLIAETLPCTEEALGIARAMQAPGHPYIISFVISRGGCVLDGRSLSEAIALIDADGDHPPLGYMVNCAHPSFLCAADQPAELFSRLIGYQANTSALDHCDLDRADRLDRDDLSTWGDLMLELNRTYGVQILGGCCGTSNDHLQYIIRHQ